MMFASLSVQQKLPKTDEKAVLVDGEESTTIFSHESMSNN